jgi:2-aminoethylphosphonate-pyruvate transaminase
MTRVSTAVILAAGMGSRLGPASGGRPKGLLELDGQSLVSRSVKQVRAVGVERVVLVAGFRAQDYLDAFAGHSDVEIVVNQRYQHSGSMSSLGTVREAVTEDFLVLESDLLYESRALDAVLGHEGRNVLLTSGMTGSGDEVWVEQRNGWLVGLSKNANHLSGVYGELVGITRVSQALFTAMCAVAEERPGMEYESALAAAAKAVPVACHMVPDLVWSEIDDPGHLHRAQTVVVPCLQASGDW